MSEDVTAGDRGTAPADEDPTNSVEADPPMDPVQTLDGRSSLSDRRTAGRDPRSVKRQNTVQEAAEAISAREDDGIPKTPRAESPRGVSFRADVSPGKVATLAQTFSTSLTLSPGSYASLVRTRVSAYVNAPARLSESLSISSSDAKALDSTQLANYPGFEGAVAGDASPASVRLHDGINIDQPVTENDCVLMLRKARRLLRDGLFVYVVLIHKPKVGEMKKLFRKKTDVTPPIPEGSVCRKHRRQLYVSFQPEYLELTTEHGVEFILHLTAIKAMRMGLDSEAFKMYQKTPEGANIDPRTCLVVESVSGDVLSLIFDIPSERVLTQFQIRVEIAALRIRYSAIETTFKELLHQHKIDAPSACQRSILELK